MALSRLPVDQEMVVYAGTDLLREYRWLPDGVTGQDFTGWSARLLLGPARGTALIQLQTPDDGLTLTADGRIKLHITAEQNADWITANLIYVLDLTDPTGFVLRFMRGRVTVIRELEAPE